MTQFKINITEKDELNVIDINTKEEIIIVVYMKQIMKNSIRIYNEIKIY